MTFTTDYYVCIWNSSDVLSTDVLWYNTSLSLHMWARDGLLYVLLCDIGWAKWALSICLSLCTLTMDRCVRWLLPGRGSVVHSVLLYPAPCCVLSLCWLPLYWLLKYGQHGEVDNLTNSGKNLSGQMSSSLCRNYSMYRKKVSGTKMINFDNCEMFREKKRSESRGVYQRRICYTPRIAESLFHTMT